MCLYWLLNYKKMSVLLFGTCNFGDNLKMKFDEHLIWFYFIKLINIFNNSFYNLAFCFFWGISGNCFLHWQ